MNRVFQIHKLINWKWKQFVIRSGTLNLNIDCTLLDNKKINGITTTVFSSYKARGYYHLQAFNLGFIKGGFKSEDTGEFFHCRHKYSKSLSWAKNLNKLFAVLGGKFKFSAQGSDLEYLYWQWKFFPVSSDLKPPLENTTCD